MEFHFSDPQILEINAQITKLAGQVSTIEDLKAYDEAIQKRRKLCNLRPGKIPDNLKIVLKTKDKKRIKELRKTVSKPVHKKKPKNALLISRKSEKLKPDLEEDEFLAEANLKIKRLNEQIYDNNAIWRNKKLRKERKVVIEEFYPSGGLPQELKLKKSKKELAAEEKKNKPKKPRTRGKKRKADMRTVTKRRTLCTFRDKKKRKPNVLSKQWNEALGLET